MKNKILLVTGGTGGHLFPAISLAQEFKKQNINFEFIIDRKCEGYLKNYKIKCNVVFSSPIFFSLLKLPISIIKIIIGFFQSTLLFLRERKKIKVIIGFGGYSCFPSLVAGYFLNIPIIIHEQNAIMGKANRILSKFCHKTFISFRKTEKAPKNSKFTGVPVRKEFFVKKKLKAHYSSNKINILILGGSQGAAVFSRIIPNVLSSLSNSEISKIKVTQQARENEIESLSKTYKKIKLSTKIKKFFRNVALEMHKSDVIISRCGASTLAEISATEKFSILFPLPTSKDNHQFKNASEFSKINSCIVMNENKFNSFDLTNLFKKIIKKPEKFKNKLTTNPNTNVAKDIVAIIKNYKNVRY